MFHLLVGPDKPNSWSIRRLICQTAWTNSRPKWPPFTTVMTSSHWRPETIGERQVINNFFGFWSLQFRYPQVNLSTSSKRKMCLSSASKIDSGVTPAAIAVKWQPSRFLQHPRCPRAVSGTPKRTSPNHS